MLTPPVRPQCVFLLQCALLIFLLFHSDDPLWCQLAFKMTLKYELVVWLYVCVLSYVCVCVCLCSILELVLNLTPPALSPESQHQTLYQETPTMDMWNSELSETFNPVA